MFQGIQECATGTALETLSNLQIRFWIFWLWSAILVVPIKSKSSFDFLFIFGFYCTINPMPYRGVYILLSCMVVQRRDTDNYLIIIPWFQGIFFVLQKLQERTSWLHLLRMPMLTWHFYEFWVSSRLYVVHIIEFHLKI